MSCYSFLAPWYDSLTGDVPYGEFADFYESEFRRQGGEFRLLLDLCCGTGTLSCELARRGYDMIAVDASTEMLMEAQAKAAGLEPPPLFLCQDAAGLDLYGTVDGAVSSLDGMNYIPPEQLPEVFRRLHLFIRPGGLLIFDIRTPDFLRSLDGDVFVDEKEDLLCLWRADFEEEAGRHLRHGHFLPAWPALGAGERGAYGVCPPAFPAERAAGAGGLCPGHSPHRLSPGRSGAAFHHGTKAVTGVFLWTE